MLQQRTQKVALDSCVVIDLIEKPGLAKKIRAGLSGKSIRIVLCDIVLKEVQKVRGFGPGIIISKITKLLGRKVDYEKVSEDQKAIAKEITSQYQICHTGDNFILTLCKAKDFVLITFDKMLLRTCQFVGIVAFHPSMVRGI